MTTSFVVALRRRGEARGGVVEKKRTEEKHRKPGRKGEKGKETKIGRREREGGGRVREEEE